MKERERERERKIYEIHTPTSNSFTGPWVGGGAESIAMYLKNIKEIDRERERERERERKRERIIRG